MKTAAYLKEAVIAAICETRWFATAPKGLPLKVLLVGVEIRQYRSILGGVVSRPVIVADATIGGETQQFAIPIDVGPANEI